MNRQPVKWSYDDPESCARAMEAAMNDPELIAEILQINREFECTTADGLNDDDWSELLKPDAYMKKTDGS